ncbi:MFS transporter [Methanobrevibacter ruminantium M1]|uniref:MFS transporter n=1 Tax=Methanobrevibacter ruminantium (strain ATCC 35063 / DSM 1093 / JCM 13430 / OCM 146 / M1) TaxID=634498 RepID=D3DZB2_METRM|nr:MFS transporter [Methanobrevibacter ruminantium]ADC46067.1 MFS transporter [Methanobrevibacter ruminantium M1]
MQGKTLDTRTRNLILILFLIGVFMGSLDTGIIGPVLPSIEQSFHLTSRESSWIFTLFVITFMIGSPVMAKFSDFYGRKKIFILDVLLFGIGSCLIAASISIELIFLGRLIQGFGCGGIFPVAGAFVGDGFPLEERGKALGILGSVFGISAIGGPLVGAALIPYGWNWCFTINIPIAIFLIIFAWYILPDSDNDRKLKIDYLGILILSLLAIFLSYGLNQIDSSNFIASLLSLNVLPFLVIFIILIPIFLKVEKKAEESIVPIHMLKNKEISIACIETLCYGIIYSSAIFIPSLVILSMGLDDQLASLMLIPILGANAVAAPILGKILDKTGSKKLMAMGTMILAIGLIAIAIYPSNLIFFIIAGCLIGVGLVTIIGAPLRYIVLTEAKPYERGAGQAIVNMLSSAGQLIGGALIGGIIASFTGILGYQVSLIIAAIVALIAFAFTLRLKGRDEQIATMKANQ